MDNKRGLVWGNFCETRRQAESDLPKCLPPTPCPQLFANQHAAVCHYLPSILTLGKRYLAKSAPAQQPVCQEADHADRNR